MLISVSMALESLKEVVGAVDEDIAKLARDRAVRDDLICDAIDAKVRYTTISRITGLSRDRLNTIVNSHRRGVSQL